eukprot:TRINITY_DN12108_c0_g1_i7.p3 TRINITY_DN12108_c0_g1~~TRINITY_DN12108_c0_g1_i7.p3  ORF type:complete len:106 (+),score=2.36 TRINITY_DN12108_c0_g1_i7:768-1085(+)
MIIFFVAHTPTHSPRVWVLCIALHPEQHPRSIPSAGTSVPQALPSVMIPPCPPGMLMRASGKNGFAELRPPPAPPAKAMPPPPPPSAKKQGGKEGNDGDCLFKCK